LGLTPDVGSIFSAPLPNSLFNRQLESLWRATKIRDVLPWEDIADEAERLLAVNKASRNAANKVTTVESRKTPRGGGRMKKTPTKRSFLGEGDLTL